MTRRRAAVTLALVGLLMGCSAETERREGVVERWLLSLNQGGAGRPGVYAPDDVSEQVLPGWRDLEPGQLDQIEIGTDRGSLQCVEHCADVPFLVADLDGTVTEGVAVVESVSATRWRVTRVEAGDSGLSVEGSAWSVAGAPGPAWLVAVGAAIFFAVLAVLLVRVVRRPEGERP